MDVAGNAELERPTLAERPDPIGKPA